MLTDLGAFSPDRLVVLGDVVGYGPDPVPCLELVLERANVLLLGNHEHDALYGPGPRTSESAAATLAWTRGQVAGSRAWAEIERRVLQAAPRGGVSALANTVEQGLRLVHAAPEDPLHRYAWPGNRGMHLWANAAIDRGLLRILDSFGERHGFCGHTHVPALLLPYAHHPVLRGTPRWNREMTFVGPNAVFFVPAGDTRVQGLRGVHALCNPGSVGQARDGIAAASYALYDGDSVIFRRVDYDIAVTQHKIMDMDLAPEVRMALVERLDEGR